MNLYNNFELERNENTLPMLPVYFNEKRELKKSKIKKFKDNRNDIYNRFRLREQTKPLQTRNYFKSSKVSKTSNISPNLSVTPSKVNYPADLQFTPKQDLSGKEYKNFTPSCSFMKKDKINNIFNKIKKMNKSCDELKLNVSQNRHTFELCAKKNLYF